MATLSGQAETPGTRIPIRVERLSGALVALTTTDVDGSWSTEVEPGEYLVVERWGTSRRVTVTGDAAAPSGEDYPPGSPGASPRARARREGAS
jgi:hypothetical protein